MVKKKSHKKIYYRTPPKIQEKVTFPWLENDTVIKITFSAFRPSEGESWVKDFSIKIEMQIIHFAAAEPRVKPFAFKVKSGSLGAHYFFSV